MNDYNTTAGVGKADTRNPSTTPVSFRISHELKEQLTVQAQALQMPFGQYLEMLIRKGMNAGQATGAVSHSEVSQTELKAIRQAVNDVMNVKIPQIAQWADSNLWDLSPEAVIALLKAKERAKANPEKTFWPDVRDHLVQMMVDQESYPGECEATTGYSWQEFKKILDPENKSELIHKDYEN